VITTSALFFAPEALNLVSLLLINLTALHCSETGKVAEKYSGGIMLFNQVLCVCRLSAEEGQVRGICVLFIRLFCGFKTRHGIRSVVHT
jgi:hypothetical protein